MSRIYSLLLLCALFGQGNAQTLGGKAAYQFLKLPSSPLLSAAGGVNVSFDGNEVGLSANNPSLLNQGLNKQLQTSFLSIVGQSRNYALTGSLYSVKLKTAFGGHVSYVDHGTMANTNATGNVMGNFRPVDYVVQASAAKKYLEKWTYGFTAKFINSVYGQYRSSAFAADIGILFRDSSKQLTASVVIKNAGVQLKRYAAEPEELPFDVQAGVTKRLAKAPFGFSVTARHLQRFEMLDDDESFNRENNLPNSSTFEKLFSHVVLATHVYLGQNLEATIGYNFLQRHELSIGTEGNGLTGFSGGLRMRFNKLQIIYSRNSYQRGFSSNQIGITFHLDRLIGL